MNQRLDLYSSYRILMSLCNQWTSLCQVVQLVGQFLLISSGCSRRAKLSWFASQLADTNIISTMNAGWLIFDSWFLVTRLDFANEDQLAASSCFSLLCFSVFRPLKQVFSLFSAYVHVCSCVFCNFLATDLKAVSVTLKYLCLHFMHLQCCVLEK